MEEYGGAFKRVHQFVSAVVDLATDTQLHLAGQAQELQKQLVALDWRQSAGLDGGGAAVYSTKLKVGARPPACLVAGHLRKASSMCRQQHTAPSHMPALMLRCRSSATTWLSCCPTAAPERCCRASWCEWPLLPRDVGVLLGAVHAGRVSQSSCLQIQLVPPNAGTTMGTPRCGTCQSSRTRSSSRLPSQRQAKPSWWTTTGSCQPPSGR
jgi:hypothetical protein